ncbi:MAG: hypothetical protein IJL76_03565 [Bacilli bacterium]|nr:hypothetical protein [Bacilli bacterium]
MAQRRKKTKNTNKYYDLENNIDTGVSIKKIIGTIIGVALVFAAIYGCTVLVLNKGEKRQPVGEATISYEMILAGSSLKQSEDSYLVVFYSDDDEIFNAITEYEGLGKEAIYYVDLTDGLNKYVISDKPNFDVKSAADLRVKDPTVIKVKKGKIVENKIGKKKVIEYLKP